MPLQCTRTFPPEDRALLMKSRALYEMAFASWNDWKGKGGILTADRHGSGSVPRCLSHLTPGRRNAEENAHEQRKLLSHRGCRDFAGFSLLSGVNKLAYMCVTPSSRSVSRDFEIKKGPRRRLGTIS
jgi:hypothetical protein